VSDINNLVVVSDLHCGCRVGLCPPSIRLDEGGTYSFGAVQKHLWKWWGEFWDDWVPKVTRGEPYAVLVNGDTTDGAHHRSKTQISQNFADQENIAAEVLAPIVEKCQGRFYMVRGTEAHVGASAENEERLGRRIGAHESNNQFTQYEYWFRVGEGLIHAAHHIGTTGRAAYETSALMAELMEMFVEASKWREEPPDVVIRCLSEDTEILTKYGWRGIEHAGDMGEVLTFNAFTEEMQWQTPLDYVVNDVEPEMVHMTGKGMDIMVTPDHTMVVGSKSSRWGWGGWRPAPMSDLVDWAENKPHNGSRAFVPVSGKYKGHRVNLTDDELWLVGLIMADGSFVRGGGGRRYAIRIAQADERGEDIEAALLAAGIDNFTRSDNVRAGAERYDRRSGKYAYTRKSCSSWYIPKEKAMKLIGFLEYDKSLACWMMEMEGDQFAHLLDGFHYGDGARGANRLHNANKKIIDQFQELMVKHGYKSSYNDRRAYTNKAGETVRVYCLNYVPGMTMASVGQKHRTNGIKRVKYSGRSWCVSVPNGTIVIRRNGCVSIVGNSHRHRHIKVEVPTANTYGMVFTTPGWQGKTPFVYKIPGGRVTRPQFGGGIVRQGDEELYTRHYTVSLPRPRPEVI